MAGRGRKISSIVFEAPEELKYMVLVVESFGIKIADVHFDSKNGMGCLVFEKGNNSHSIGKIRRIVEKYNKEGVSMVKLDDHWYLSFPESHINILSEYMSILKEIT